MFLDTFAASRLLKFLTHRLDPPDLPRATKLFSQIRHPDLFSYNLLLQAFCRSLFPLRSFIFYRDLLRRGLRPNGYTLCFLLGCCSAAAALREGRQVHGHFAKMGLLRRCLYATTALVQFYGDSGDPDIARKMFDEMNSRSEISWGVLVMAYAERGRLDDALKVLEEMTKLGIQPCNSTIVFILCACAKLGELFLGKMVHGFLTVRGLELNITLGTSLVGMYAKCGAIAAADEVFSAMPAKSVGSWNCMIHGLAVNGGGGAAIRLFEEMQRLNIPPDGATFLGILTACRHSGDVAGGSEFFSQMIEEHRILPSLKHYGCMVDLYGRAGNVGEALAVVRSMPMEPDAAIWGALLSSCRAAGDWLLGEVVAARLVKILPREASGYLFLSEVFASSMRWDAAAEVRKAMAEMGTRKAAAGWSSMVL
ncbi:unnamed protein product [Spirodela intermedia]|uniref:Uncharacterized protein n=1 Tax=Spirodela intermedia TaxID=51605 RepID=A0A7I8JWV6_SPIIN|nr:unnamed protein product [Spirodela intermedia]